MDTLVRLALDAPGERAGEVGRVLLTGLGVVLGLVAIAAAAFMLGKALGWMIDKRWPIAVYAAAAIGLILIGYIFDRTLMYYGIGALILPVLLLMFMALIGF